MRTPRAISAIALALALTLSAGVADAAARPASTQPDFGAFLVGQFAFSQSDPGRAAPAYLRALAADPDNPLLLREAFLASLLSGQKDAVRLARQLPDNQLAQLLLANQAAKSGHWAAATQRFHALSSQGLGALVRPLLLSWAEQGDGRTEAALATLRPYAEGQTFPGLYALNAAMIADLAGRNAAAARYYHIAQSRGGAPGLTEAQSLASWQARQGDKVGALATLAALARGQQAFAMVLPALARNIETRPVNSPIDGMAQVYIALSSAPGEQNVPELSMAMLRLALDLEPDLAAARFQASLLLSDDDHPAQALAMLGTIPRNDPVAPLMVLEAASLQSDLGRDADAIASLQTLAAAHPDSPLPDQQLGDLFLDRHRYKEAVAAYDRALARVTPPAPDAWHLYYTRGIAYDRSGEWPKAEADFRQALHISPDQPAVLNYLGYSLADRNQDLSQAAAMIERAVARLPQDGAIVDSLGWVRLRQGDIAGAVRALERAVELEPGDPEINTHLGVAYWQAGRKLEAIYQWHRALNLSPSPKEAAHIRALLQQDTLAAPLSMRASP